MAESSRRPRDDNNEEEEAHKQSARKAFARLQSMAVAMGTLDASRVARQLSRWSNPLHMQWKEINDTVDTNMVKAIWPISDSNANKGRWKITKCTNEDIRNNAEQIAMEVFGHALHNHDAPLYFAKMLYMHFVLKKPVDFSSKDTPQSASTTKSNSVTLSREELVLALEGAQLELTASKEALKRSLEEKEQEARRILETATPVRQQQRVQSDIRHMRDDVGKLLQRVGEKGASSILPLVQHPEIIASSTQPPASGTYQCPGCRKYFDTWSGHYTLSCGHIYHLACLLRSMVLGEPCLVCNAAFPHALYTLFSLQVPQPSQEPPRPHQSDSSIIRNLNETFDE